MGLAIPDRSMDLSPTVCLSFSLKFKFTVIPVFNNVLFLFGELPADMQFDKSEFFF